MTVEIHTGASWFTTPNGRHDSIAQKTTIQFKLL
jgi:hypothetical protein